MIRVRIRWRLGCRVQSVCDQSSGTIRVRVRSGLGYDQGQGAIRVSVPSELGYHQI